MEINIAEVVAQAIAFCILLGVLRWKAWKPIQESLRLRREKIHSEFDGIDAAKRDIEALKSQYHSQLQKIEDEARAKMLAAIEEGQRISKELQEKTRLDAQASFEKATENIGIEVAKARLTLRREIADLALDAAERVLNEKLASDKAQQAKIMEIIEDLEKTL